MIQCTPLVHARDLDFHAVGPQTKPENMPSGLQCKKEGKKIGGPI